jgi:hypothetical protein
MKSLRQLSAAVVLTFAVALSVSAGDMDTPLTSPQTGHMSTGVRGDMDTPITQIVAGLIQGVLALV